MEDTKEMEMSSREKELVRKYGAPAWQTYLNIFNALLTGVLQTLNQGLGVLNLFHPHAALFLLDFLEDKIKKLFAELRIQIEEAAKVVDSKEKLNPTHLELVTDKKPQ